MSSLTIDQALENIYASIMDYNRDLDQHIAALKDAMKAAGQKEVQVDTAKLAQNNRQGRKLMQAYFRQRGVAISFSEKEAAK